jgi:tetratricopeptide (TPR) repeat protein
LKEQAVLPNSREPGEDAAPRSESKVVWILFAILAVALLLRAYHLVEIRRAPFIQSPVIDARHFHVEANRIASGQWIGETAYQKGPLYTHVLAAMHAASGSSITVALGFQLLAGVLVCYLVYRLGKLLFGVTEGLAAAAFAAVYRPLVFFEGQLLAAWLAVLTVVLFLLAIAAASRRPTGWRWLVSGLLLGIAILVRGNLLVVIPFGLLWIVWRGYRGLLPRRATALGALLFLAGSVAPILPAALHNYLAEGEFVALTSTSGINLYTGNRPGADGYSAIPVHSAWESAMDEAYAAGARTSATQSAYWTRRAFDSARRHPGATARLLLKKVFLLWDAFEYPNNLSFRFVQRFSTALRFPVPGFGILATLGLTGLFVLRDRRSYGTGLLGWFLVFGTVSVVPFFACDRYRMPLLPALLCLGGATVVWFCRRVRRRNWRRLAWSLVPLALIAVVVNVDLYRARPARVARDFVALGDSYRYGNRLPEAAAAYRRAIEIDPADPDARALAGRVLLQLGRPREAEGMLREAARLRPEYALPRALLARILYQENRLLEAIDVLETLVAQYPWKGEPFFLLGECYRGLGRHGQAVAAYREATASLPDLAPAFSGLAASLVEIGDRPEEALDAAERAAALSPSNPMVLLTLSAAREATGDVEGALTAARSALGASRNHPSIRSRVSDIESRLSR